MKKTDRFFQTLIGKGFNFFIFYKNEPITQRLLRPFKVIMSLQLFPGLFFILIIIFISAAKRYRLSA